MSKNDINVHISDVRRLARVGLLLIPDFALMSYASVVEPLRAANILSGKELYRWRHIAVRGHDVTASNGVRIQADVGLANAGRFDIIFVFAGGNPQAFHHAPTLAFLRQAARHGIRLGGVSAGPYVLAKAGLLDGYRCTLHWEHVPAFAETFPFINLSRSLFEIDRDRLTCAGGIAALDMMHALIQSEHGAALAAAVSDWFLQTEVRRGEVAQRLSPTERFGTHKAELVDTLLLMEKRIEPPLSRAQLARRAGVTIRQLERMFADSLGTTIGRRYLKIRLERARVLLRQTTMTIADVGWATGFSTSAHFSRKYRQQFGISPSSERRRSP